MKIGTRECPECRGRGETHINILCKACMGNGVLPIYRSIMTTHKLKTWPQYFEPLAQQRKNFEVRKNDRVFGEGDRLELREWDPECKYYTGRVCYRTIDYILQGGQFGIEPGYVVLSLSF